MPATNTEPCDNHLEIEIYSKQESTAVPEAIEFVTMFIFPDQSVYQRSLEREHEALLAFLRETRIPFQGPVENHMQNGEFAYNYPSYTLLLNWESYQKVEVYLEGHPQVDGTVRKALFKAENHIELLLSIILEAQREAQEIVTQQKLTLLPEYEFTSFNSGGAWRVFPPAGSKVNHFDQRLEEQYKFVFRVQYQ